MPTPDQQALYDQYVKNGMRLAYNKKGVKQLVASLDGNGDPVGGLANTLSALSLRLTESAKKSGKPLPPEVILHGSGELMAQLADFSAESGGHKYSETELKELATNLANGFKPQHPQQAPAAPTQQPAAGMPQLMP